MAPPKESGDAAGAAADRPAWQVARSVFADLSTALSYARLAPAWVTDAAAWATWFCNCAMSVAVGCRRASSAAAAASYWP